MAHKARKRFGQHFLHDTQVLHRISHAILSSSKYPLLEIGPGKGALTDYLIHHENPLYLVELDRDLIQLLKQKYQHLPNVHIYQGDILNFDLNQINTEIQVAGNLPYNISTPLIFHLLTFPHVKTMVFMLQQEVVERMIASPGNRNYGRLSIMVQYRAQAEMLFTVGKEAFSPPPKVNSAIVRLTPFSKPAYPHLNQALFEQVVKKAFSQRRKTIVNALKGLINKQQIMDQEIDPQLRAENLTIQNFVSLTSEIDK